MSLSGLVDDLFVVWGWIRRELPECLTQNTCTTWYLNFGTTSIESFWLFLHTCVLVHALRLIQH